MSFGCTRADWCHEVEECGDDDRKGFLSRCSSLAEETWRAEWWCGYLQPGGHFGGPLLSAVLWYLPDPLESPQPSHSCPYFAFAPHSIFFCLSVLRQGGLDSLVNPLVSQPALSWDWQKLSCSPIHFCSEGREKGLTPWGVKGWKQWSDQGTAITSVCKCGLSWRKLRCCFSHPADRPIRGHILPGNILQILTDTGSSPKVQTLLLVNTYIYAIALKAKISVQSGAKLPVFTLDLGQSNPFCTWAKALVFGDEVERFVLETFLVIQLQDAWHCWTPMKESDVRKQMKAATWLKRTAEVGLRMGFGLYHWTFVGPNMIWKLFQYSIESTCQGAWTASFITVPLLVLVSTRVYNFFH